MIDDVYECVSSFLKYVLEQGMRETSSAAEALLFNAVPKELVDQTITSKRRAHKTRHGCYNS